MTNLGDSFASAKTFRCLEILEGQNWIDRQIGTNMQRQYDFPFFYITFLLLTPMENKERSSFEKNIQVLVMCQKEIKLSHFFFFFLLLRRMSEMCFRKIRKRDKDTKRRENVATFSSLDAIFPSFLFSPVSQRVLDTWSSVKVFSKTFQEPVFLVSFLAAIRCWLRCQHVNMKGNQFDRSVLSSTDSVPSNEFSQASSDGKSVCL